VAQQLAVVTGASSGIGAATARILVASGWTVVLVARRERRLRELAQRLTAIGAGQCLVEPLDGADPDAVAAMAARVRSRFGAPGAIVNSAGAGVWRWPEDTPPAEMERLLDAPFRSAYHVTSAFLPDLLGQRAGVVVHVGSPASITTWPGATGYAVSRWALRGYHEALVQDLHGTGVRSCHVIFGEVTSEYFTANSGSREHIPGLGRLIPRITPSQAAEVIVRTIHAPRDEVLHPPMLAALRLGNRFAPGTVRTLARVTGRRRYGRRAA
jgi:uncharacterized protein